MRPRIHTHTVWVTHKGLSLSPCNYWSNNIFGLESQMLDLVPALCVGTLLVSWFMGGSNQPADIPSRLHSHHCEGAAQPVLLSRRDLGLEAPLTAESSFMGIVETWLGPSKPANSAHYFSPADLAPTKNR